DLVQETPVSSNGRAEDVVQKTLASSNVRQKHGVTLMQRIWSLPTNMKIQCELNVRGQPIGESGQTFKRWLGTFCLNPDLCPLMPVAWMQTLIDMNKRSRGFQNDIARSEPISFAQTADNMAKESGQAVERAVVFAKVYCTKDRHPISTEVREKIVSPIT
ncbi:hypothetical protein CFP56_002479, partial [Quercus suber]